MMHLRPPKTDLDVRVRHNLCHEPKFLVGAGFEHPRTIQNNKRQQLQQLSQMTWYFWWHISNTAGSSGWTGYTPGLKSLTRARPGRHPTRQPGMTRATRAVH